MLVSDERLSVEERHDDRNGRLARTMHFDDVNNPGDGSGIVGPALTYTFSDAVSLLGTVYVPYGQPPDGRLLRSEYGAAPLSGLLQLRLYF